MINHYHRSIYDDNKLLLIRFTIPSIRNANDTLHNFY